MSRSRDQLHEALMLILFDQPNHTVRIPGMRMMLGARLEDYAVEIFNDIASDQVVVRLRKKDNMGDFFRPPPPAPPVLRQLQELGYPMETGTPGQTATEVMQKALQARQNAFMQDMIEQKKRESIMQLMRQFEVQNNVDLAKLFGGSINKIDSPPPPEPATPSLPTKPEDSMTFGQVFGEMLPVPPPPPPITAWSYSRLQTYAKCPRQAKYKFVDRLPEPPPPAAMMRGREMHGHCERVLRDRLSGIMVPTPLQSHLDLFNRLNAHGCEPEKQVAFDIDWKPTDWFSKTAYVRVVFDGMYVLRGGSFPTTVSVVEFKTGKAYDDHKDQETLYAAAAASLVEDAEQVDVQLVYLDNPALTPAEPREFSRDEALSYIKVWDDKARPMLTDTTFAARQGRHCAFCAFAKSKGGPCELG